MKFHSSITQNSGIPLGGLGTGTVEIRADGYFHEWQIYNLGKWAPRQPFKTKRSIPADPGPETLAFYLRVQQESQPPVIRRLGMRTDQNELYSLAWVKPVQSIEYDGQFPVVKLKYIDETLPINIHGSFYSPIIPHDSRTSGTPGFYATFSITNKSSTPVNVALTGILQNLLARDAKDRKLINTIHQSENGTILHMTTTATKCNPATIGSIALGVYGGNPSWIATDYRGYFKGYHARCPDFNGYDTFLYELRSKGQLPNLGDNQPCPSKLLRFVPVDKLKKQQYVDQFKNYAFAQDVLHRYQEVDPKILDSNSGINSYLQALVYRLYSLGTISRDCQFWGDGALCSDFTLAPQTTIEITFVLSWYFPNHFSQRGQRLGHMYEHWFSDAKTTAEFLLCQREDFKKKVFSFSQALFDTTLDANLAEAWAGQLTTLTKCTWWTKDNDFAVWEGLGCCGFHTMDITYQGSWNILALYPELQKSQMILGSQFQRADGRVHHFFTPDLEKVDHGFDRVDMNPQFVLLVCRDYLWTADRKYLELLYPHIIRAMDNSQLLDMDGDGLPDHDTRRNTYDGWNFFGTPSYIASLWLAALKAAIRMAQDMQDPEHSQKWQDLLQRGIINFEKKLWNGEYFNLWDDGLRRDECCMTDQLSGEWFAHLIGLGNAVSLDKIRTALSSVIRYNFSEERGLINASYPPGRSPVFPTHHNIQAMAPWTGVEYAIGSMMLDLGLINEGINVIKAINDRYLRAGRFWNHVECGDHYYRAMCSWAVLLAATGFKIDSIHGKLMIQPKISQGKAPWFASAAWGSINWGSGQLRLQCESGSINISELQINGTPKNQIITLDGNQIEATFSILKEQIIIRFKQPLQLSAGNLLAVE